MAAGPRTEERVPLIKRKAIKGATDVRLSVPGLGNTGIAMAATGVSPLAAGPSRVLGSRSLTLEPSAE